MERVAGPIDWTLAMVQEDVDRSSQGFLLGTTNVHLKLYTTAVLFWSLKWGMVKDYTGINVDRSTGAVISQTVNIEMNGFEGSNVGDIILPGAGANWWPVP